MITLDTDVVSVLMRPRPPVRLLERLAGTPVAEQSTTAVTLGELSYGAQRVGRPELYRRARELLDDVRVLGFGEEAAGHYGALRARLEAAGLGLADPDLRIAAIVRAHGTTLVTGNLRHFARVPGIRAEDWIRG